VILKKPTYYKDYFLGEIERLINLKQKHVVTPRQAINQWLTQLETPTEVKGRILVTAFRTHTWVEWAVYFAIIARNLGFETTLLIKEEDIMRLYPEAKKNNFWMRIQEIPGIKLTLLNNLPYDQKDFDYYYQSNLKKCADSLAYENRIESANILEENDTFGEIIEKYRLYAAKCSAGFYKYIRENEFYSFYCFSGLIGETFALLDAALESKLTTVCIEGWAWRKGHMIYNFNGPALEYNVNGWMKHFGKWTEEKENDLRSYFKFLNGEVRKETWLKEFYNVQQAKVESEIPDYILKFLEGGEKVYLLACNVIGDSSLLNRERIFKSHQAFIEKTVNYFKNNPSKKLIIRAHPGEEWVESKVKIKMGTFSKKIANGIPNILVIDYREKINTFSLIPYSKVGLVWLTSAGVDFVVRGIPVIAVANAKYSGLGIMDEPATEEEYYSLLDTYDQGNIVPNESQKQKAMEYLYMVFKGFSFEAFGKNFSAGSTIMNKMSNQKEHDTFYKIILGLIPAPDTN
jgi:hypothetical protein